MAAMNTPITPKQKAAAERIASYGAEQRRLKAAAASRRAAAASDEKADQRSRAKPERSPSVARRSRYLG
jgi:hypothetical protein